MNVQDIIALVLAVFNVLFFWLHNRRTRKAFVQGLRENRTLLSTAITDILKQWNEAGKL